MNPSNANPEEATERQTRDQERAAAAWKATPENPGEEYVSLVRGAAASIMTMGLGQTLALYRSKDTEHHRRLANALARWLLDDPEADGEALLDTIAHEDSSAQYRRRTTEAVAYLSWLKRLAEANAQSSAPSHE
jgi:CRISPR type III-B/RAMP module-associated protein Cmr5